MKGERAGLSIKFSDKEIFDQHHPSDSDIAGEIKVCPKNCTKSPDDQQNRLFTDKFPYGWKSRFLHFSAPLTCGRYGVLKGKSYIAIQFSLELDQDVIHVYNKAKMSVLRLYFVPYRKFL